MRALLKRIPKWLRAVTVLGVGLVGFLTFQWFVSPASVHPSDVGDVDAVFLFAGGDGERLPAAVEAVAASRVDVLVIPNGTDPDWSDANDLCTGARVVTAEVICLVPDPDTTVGEARMLGRLADERGWTSVAIVSSTYHIERVALLAGRCYDGHLLRVRADPQVSVLNWARRFGHEWIALAHATTFRRGC